MNVPMPAETELTNDTPPLMQQTATVRSVEGNRCELDIAGTPCPAAISTHLLSLQPGQRVVALRGDDNTWLVTAAWPMASDDALFRFDPASGALHIQAPRLTLAALGSVELHCGDARISLGVDGKVTVLGKEVLSSAVGSHRIEGATIDLN
jgi:hypothetical protein